MKYLIAAICIVPLLGFGQAQKKNLITVVGDAKIEVDPNWINLGMSASEKENLRKESDVVNMEKAITAFISELGLDPESFKIDRYSASTNYYSSSSKFRLNKSYSLKLEKLEHLDAIIDKCFKSGMDHIYVKEVGHSEMDSLKSKALEKALKSAKSKADLIASTMNVNITNVNTILEPYELIGQVGSNDYQLESMAMSRRFRDERVGSDLNFQKIRVTKSILAKFEIE